MPNPSNQIWNLLVLSDIDILYQHLRSFLGIPGTEYVGAYSDEESNIQLSPKGGFARMNKALTMIMNHTQKIYGDGFPCFLWLRVSPSSGPPILFWLSLPTADLVPIQLFCKDFQGKKLKWKIRFFSRPIFFLKIYTGIWSRELVHLLQSNAGAGNFLGTNNHV